MTQSVVTIDGLTKLANDLKNKLDIVEANNKALYTCVESQVLMISRLEKQRDELLEALKYLYGVTETPTDKNCSCHTNPLCSDCIEYRGLREAINFARKAIAKAKGE